MRLLLTNDDGVNAKGIYTLAKELEKKHEIIIVAPDVEKSASSHSITVRDPLFVKQVKLKGIKSKAYSVTGTPADCVKIAIDKIVDGNIDMVLSGINNGLNIGLDVLYSGTVSAAIEAAVNKIPSLAASMEVEDGVEGDYEDAAKCVLEVLEKLEDKYLKDDVVFNLNMPMKLEKGIKVCKIGERGYTGYFIEVDSKGEGKTFKLKGKVSDSHSSGTDGDFIKQGYATLTPLHYDLTNFKILEQVDKIFK